MKEDNSIDYLSIKIGEKTFFPDENTPADWRNIGLLKHLDKIYFILYNTETSELIFLITRQQSFLKNKNYLLEQMVLPSQEIIKFISMIITEE